MTTAALLGFLGGIAAVAAKSYVDLWIEARRDARAIQAVARLVRDELSTTSSYMRVVVDASEWWGTDKRQTFDTHAWEEHKQFLAAHLKYTEWSAVTMAYGSVRSLAQRYARAMGPEPLREPGNTAPFEAVFGRLYEQEIKFINHGMETLARYTWERHSAWRKWKARIRRVGRKVRHPRSE